MKTEHTFDHPFMAGSPEVQPGGASVPSDLDRWEPGLFSHAVLSSIDRSRLSSRDLVTVLRTEARLIAHLEALHAQTVSQLAHVDPADPEASTWTAEVWDEAADELGAALNLTRRGANMKLDRALRLTEHEPVWKALLSGDIDAYRAGVITHGVRGLKPDAARAVLSRLVPQAPTLTSGQLRARLRRLRIDADPDAAEDRYRRGVEDRMVAVGANDDGTATLSGYQLPPDRVAEARDRIERIVRSLKTDGELRTLDQLRADVYLDLLCGTAHQEAARGVVDIEVDLETLAGLTDTPGRLPGWGPVIADIARRLATEHGRRWEVTLTHEKRPVWTGVTRRRPDAATARIVRRRHRRCVFPGCRMPARSCDLDHTVPWCEGGATCPHNLVPLCRHHHGLRDKGWDYQPLEDGRFRWTSPLGWTYTTRPPP